MKNYEAPELKVINFDEKEMTMATSYPTLDGDWQGAETHDN